MPDYDYDIGVIGGGATGLTVTSGAAQLGAKALLVEKEQELGGDCLHFGCVPSKTLLKSAHVYHLMKNAAKFGLPAVTVPPVDFKQVSQRIRSVIGTIQHHDSRERFCKLGAQVEFGQPKFADDHSIVLNGKTYSAKTWVIATGSSPSAPPIKGLDQTPYITNCLACASTLVPHNRQALRIISEGTYELEVLCRCGCNTVSYSERVHSNTTEPSATRPWPGSKRICSITCIPDT